MRLLRWHLLCALLVLMTLMTATGIRASATAIPHLGVHTTGGTNNKQDWYQGRSRT
jgi:hypothetical protein